MKKQKLVIIFGAQAVGKMTVGMELAKRTDLKLFHNHMTIEPVLNFFDYSSIEGRRLVKLFREEVFKAVAGSNLKGMVFTYIWNFDIKDDWKEIEHIKEVFNNFDIYFLELEADVEERLKRNKTELRLKEKKSKRNIEWSENDLLNSYKTKRLNSRNGEIKEKNYIKINNTKLSPKEVVDIFLEKFFIK